MKVVLVDNGSTSPETVQGMKAARSHYPSLMIETLRADYPFNFSKLNNDGFRNCKNVGTRFVLFLNNDIELLGNDTIQKMAICLTNIPDAGVVGSTLLYPEGNIQHLFAAPGVKIIAAHPLKGTPFNQLTDWFEKPMRPVPAVTGAVMMLRAEDFERVGMFDEALPTLGQDVVLCARVLQKLQKFSVVLTKADVLHHESVTKSVSFPAAELKLIYDRYGDALNSKTFFNHVFSRWSERPLIALPWELSYPAKTVARFWQ
jgi:GT2 family glycosyltransferase